MRPIAHPPLRYASLAHARPTHPLVAQWVYTLRVWFIER